MRRMKRHFGQHEKASVGSQRTSPGKAPTARLSLQGKQDPLYPRPDRPDEAASRVAWQGLGRFGTGFVWQGPNNTALTGAQTWPIASRCQRHVRAEEIGVLGSSGKRRICLRDRRTVMACSQPIGPLPFLGASGHRTPASYRAISGLLRSAIRGAQLADPFKRHFCRRGCQ